MKMIVLAPSDSRRHYYLFVFIWLASLPLQNLEKPMETHTVCLCRRHHAAETLKNQRNWSFWLPHVVPGAPLLRKPWNNNGQFSFWLSQVAAESIMYFVFVCLAPLPFQNLEKPKEHQRFLIPQAHTGCGNPKKKQWKINVLDPSFLMRHHARYGRLDKHKKIQVLATPGRRRIV